MQNFLILKNTIQTYVWGSFDGIPAFTGIVNTDDEPMAELWMGAHPAAPSRVRIGKGDSVPLDKYIAEHSVEILGKETLDRYGATLPFLFKVLSAANPLSLQVHPTKAQAETGWKRENDSAIPLLSPNRNYKDNNHKQEILLAISPFTVMCGFRSPEKIRELLSLVDSPIIRESLARLESEGYHGLCQFLLELKPEERNSSIASVIAAGPHAPSVEARSTFALVARLFAHFPHDVGCLAPLYLNVLTLKPGEVIYLPEGIMHTYISGTGLELMSNSDNTLRGGLTAKHLDVPELLKILNPAPYTPEILKPASANSSCTYKTDAKDCELTLIRLQKSEFTYQATAPAIVVGATGDITATNQSGETCPIGRGAFILIPASGERITFSGTGVCYLASTPGTAD
jgi:mannose-6-phosphate isomerase